MKKITISIPDELNKKLRDYLDLEFEGIKGSLSIVTKIAIEEYLTNKLDK